MIRRFAFIEARLLWSGGLTAGELGEAFGIARQNAQRTIDTYRRKHPGQMEYDRQRRRQTRTAGFEANYVRDEVDRFLDYQRAVTHTAHFYDEPDWADLPFTDADAFIHPIHDKESVRTLLEALRCEKVVVIDYWSKNGTRVRPISPHHLVFADGRYHVRAYCHEDLAYLDFVLSRVIAADSTDEPWVSGDTDKDWHRRQDLAFEINPSLPASVRAAMRLEYIPDGKDVLLIRGVRKALTFYVRRRLLRHDERFGLPLWGVLPDRSAP